MRWSARDHHRSRGVYVAPPRAVPRTTGSSPLARGLRVRPNDSQGVSGIIPARAGFTAGRRHRSPQAGDHPRSRGVYTFLIGNVLKYAGSSPLARGLRAASIRRCSHPRIIPARAGFTMAVPSGGGLGGDHPRSRGVYRTSTTKSSPRGGSSPLARGLPTVNGGAQAHKGIIPARAGFTSSSVSAISEVTDHPRSRGVYSPSWSSRRVLRGSSPLARGLPAVPQVVVDAGRIIPARAGFTPCFTPEASAVSGSSPLARGLRRRDGSHGDGAGIIPARAGFTVPYDVCWRSLHGSSPLARGLRRCP